MQGNEQDRPFHALQTRVHISKITYTDRLNNVLLFIWNPERKEVLGRGSESWVRISLFYCCYYMALAGFFTCCVAVFMAIIDKRMPTYAEKHSVMSRQAVDGHIVGVNPG
jgi:hypothetical protein